MRTPTSKKKIKLLRIVDCFEFCLAALTKTKIQKAKQSNRANNKTTMFFSSLARATSIKLPVIAAAATRAPVAQAAVARYASRFLSSTTPYAVDAPDGDHDLEDIEEHLAGVNRIIDVASVTEDADAITAIHEAVFGGKTMFAVTNPDGEHDLEDVVSY